MNVKTGLKATLRRWANKQPPAVRQALLGARPGGASAAENQADANRFWNDFHRRDDSVRNDDGTAPPDPLDYTRHPFLYAHSVSQPLTGDPTKFWLDEIGKRYFAPRPGRLLALGCGLAHAEEHLLSRGYAREIVAYDMSSHAIAAARARLDATEWGSRIELRCGNPLDDGIEPGSFDAAFVEAALHHFIRLDEVMALLHRCLKKDGVFVFDEYVGPDFHIYPVELVELLNRINECLGPPYRTDFESGALREHVESAKPEYIQANDPTEGVHASRILPVAYRYFHVIDRRDYGGAIVRPLFCRVISNWDLSDPRDQTVARLIILLEQELMARGALPTHNAVVVGRPRATPRPPLSGGELERIAFSDWRGLQGESRFD